MTVPGPVRTLLEMQAANNGFDRGPTEADGWLAFASTRVPLRLWLRDHGDAYYVAAFSQSNVTRNLKDHGEPVALPLPTGATAARLVPSIPAMQRMLRRAFQLSRALPDELLHVFEKSAASLPKSTEAERLVVQRVGQDIFRAGLLDYWDGRCAVTGLAIPELLRASHIKPWAECDTDAERLDIFNGLLLAPHLDAAFDRGFITVADSGDIKVAPELTDADRCRLALDHPLAIKALAEAHRPYLAWHRSHLFKGTAPAQTLDNPE